MSKPTRRRLIAMPAPAVLPAPAAVLFRAAVLGMLIVGTAAAADSFLKRTRSTSDLAEGAGDGANGHVQLREGTLIPPTPGRIVLIGRRWAFIPQSAAKGHSDQLDWTAGGVSSTGPAGFGASLDDRRDSANQVNSAGSSAVENGGTKREGAVSQMLISENLMLQRIVEAIREDPADDRWTVTGKVSEFFDQNRLILQTAQRANSR